MKTIILTEDEFLSAQTPQIQDRLSITMGVFDGLHRGHQALFKQTLIAAQEAKTKSAVVAFDFSAIDLKKRDRHLLTEKETGMALAAQGFAYYIIIHFGAALAALSPEAYLAQLTTVLPIISITVGTDFCFGKNRAGNVVLLENYAPKLKYTLHAVPLVEQDEIRISSRQIEQLLVTGDVAAANALLGYTYAMRGIVIRGEQKGRQLGYPTANMVIPAGKICLPNGVYVARVRVADKLYDAATNIGVSPTIKTETQRIVETYILDFSADIYGEEIVVYFYQRIRDEQKFSNIAALKEQMAQDIAISAEYLSKV